MMARHWRTLPWAPLGFTLALLGYLMVWLPQMAAGLSLLGVELGEWIKFTPQMRAGTLPDRNLLYLPPITLGLWLTGWTWTWPERRWQTWLARALALATALLAFPALEAILDEPAGAWRLRLLGVGLVAAAVGLSPGLRRLPPAWRAAGGCAVGLVGVLLPTWAYLALRPVAAELLRAPVGIGPGVYLNGVGHLLLAGVALAGWRSRA